MNKQFSISDAFSYGVEKTKKHWAIMLLIGIVTFLINLIYNLIPYLYAIPRDADEMLDMSSLSALTTGMFLATNIIVYIIIFWIAYNTAKLLLKINRTSKGDIKELFHYDEHTPKMMLKYFLVSLLYGLIVLVGMILLIIPGIYFSIKYIFAPYLVIDKNMSITEAFKKSADMTEGNWWNIFLFSIITIFVCLAGLLLLIVGIIPAIMLISFAWMYVYLYLLGEMDSKGNHQAEHHDKIIHESHHMDNHKKD